MEPESPPMTACRCVLLIEEPVSIAAARCVVFEASGREVCDAVTRDRVCVTIFGRVVCCPLLVAEVEVSAQSDKKPLQIDTVGDRTFVVIVTKVVCISVVEIVYVVGSTIVVSVHAESSLAALVAVVPRSVNSPGPGMNAEKSRTRLFCDMIAFTARALTRTCLHHTV